MPLPPESERPLRAVGAVRRASGTPTADELVRRLREVARDGDALVALIDAEAVAGERHLLSAWAHLGRARSRGETRLRDRGAEFLIYLAGDDQLPRAVKKVGIGESTRGFVLAAERPRELPMLLDQFGLVADPSVFPRAPTEATLDRLEITPEDRRTVPPAQWEGLVLERVALVDLTLKGRPEAARTGPDRPQKP
jgi:tRNA threonylcarbamoyladenosine modification (KEOPS) complex Cgi121 subunit